MAEIAISAEQLENDIKKMERVRWSLSDIFMRLKQIIMHRRKIARRN